MVYKAQSGAGYTLEALFGITPNGDAKPDFEDWELKSHSGSVVTLMTPQPNYGTYRDDLESFIRSFGKVKENRMDFASIHKNGEFNSKTTLTLLLEGYDREKQEIIAPDGGLHLKDENGTFSAGWRLDKLIEHWKKKHSKTCFVTYIKENGDVPYYRFGPDARLAEGATLTNFLNAIYDQAVYYDPGINMKFVGGKWKPKKRNQFRVKWKDLDELYEEIEDITL